VGRKLLYLFEDYGLDTDRRELSRGTSLIPVEPKVFDLLVYVIRNREHVVSKDDLVAAIWNGRVVSESALTTCINAARTAIGDSGEAQRLIKTLPRKGIRFVGIVREDEGKPAAAAPTVTTFEPSHPSPALPDKPSIAILPFANLSGDPEQEYFADGMVEDIITALSRFRTCS
jgi:adenylate cyclase